MTNKENPENNPTPPVTPEITPEIGTPDIPEIITPDIPEITSPEITSPEITSPEIITPEIITPEITPPVEQPVAPSMAQPPVEPPVEPLVEPPVEPPVAQGIPAYNPAYNPDYNPAPPNYNPTPLGQPILAQGPRKVRGSVIVVGIALIVALGLFLALGPLRGMIARGKLKSNPKAAITSALEKSRENIKATPFAGPNFKQFLDKGTEQNVALSVRKIPEDGYTDFTALENIALDFSYQHNAKNQELLGAISVSSPYFTSKDNEFFVSPKKFYYPFPLSTVTTNIFPLTPKPLSTIGTQVIMPLIILLSQTKLISLRSSVATLVSARILLPVQTSPLTLTLQSKKN